MDNTIVGVKRFRKDAKMPVKGTRFAAAWDVFAWIPDSENSDLSDCQNGKYFWRGDSLKYAKDITEPGGTLILQPGATVLVPTGLSLDIPHGKAVLVLPRSGQSIKGYRVANSPGLIDEDYYTNKSEEYGNFELKIILYNSSNSPITVENNDRIAQILVVDVPEVDFIEDFVNERETSDRTGGLGSTGIK